jgi:DnaJ-class molecular chaperone
LQECEDCFDKPSAACHLCDGVGELDIRRDVSPTEETGGMGEVTGSIVCTHCLGSGKEHNEEPIHGI